MSHVHGMVEARSCWLACYVCSSTPQPVRSLVMVKMVPQYLFTGGLDIQVLGSIAHQTHKRADTQEPCKTRTQRPKGAGQPHILSHTCLSKRAKNARLNDMVRTMQHEKCASLQMHGSIAAYLRSPACTKTAELTCMQHPSLKCNRYCVTTLYRMVWRLRTHFRVEQRITQEIYWCV